MHAAMEAATPFAAVLTCLEQLGRTLAIARNVALAGRRLDLAGLDGETGLVCARVLDLPVEEGRTLIPALVALRAQLEALFQALECSGAPPPI